MADKSEFHDGSGKVVNKFQLIGAGCLLLGSRVKNLGSAIALPAFGFD